MKNILRQQYKELRKNLTQAEIQNNSATIVHTLFATPFFQSAKNIMCYLSFQNEVVTDEIFLQAWKEQKQTIIPITHPNTHTITLSSFNNFSDLTLSSLKIRELPMEKQINFPKEQLDFIIIPGIAFDRMGNRLGFGQGYYDRFLEEIPPTTLKVALAFSKQIAEVPLPAEPFDIPMDYIITEKEIIFIEKTAK